MSQKDPTEKDPIWISDWNPEDEMFWNSKGKVIARRNLIWSIVAEHIGFSVWLIWSIVATKLPQAGFHFTTDQLFQLVALPGLIGSLMRLLPSCPVHWTAFDVHDREHTYVHRTDWVHHGIWKSARE